MSGIQIEYLLGIFFLVEGLSQLVVPTTQKQTAVCLFLSGVVLLILALMHIAFV